MLLSVVPASAGDIERHTGRRPTAGSDLWRLEVSGRFVASAGVMYPSGVPFPDELHNQTAIIAQEVWLYATEDGDVLGAYWWPDAVRRPIAAMPSDEYAGEVVTHPNDASQHLDIAVPIPDHDAFEAAVAVCLDRREVLVFCVTSSPPEPLNEMLLFEAGGISIRARFEERKPDVMAFLRSHQPPYRRLTVRGLPAIARDLGRSLGPQTWPWPAELRWWEEGVSFEVKGFVPIATLAEVAESLDR